MKVLRSNKDSVMAMLEAFVHDPLINWRLLNTTDTNTDLAVARDVEAKETGTPPTTTITTRIVPCHPHVLQNIGR